MCVLYTEKIFPQLIFAPFARIGANFSFLMVLNKNTTTGMYRRIKMTFRQSRKAKMTWGKITLSRNIIQRNKWKYVAGPGIELGIHASLVRFFTTELSWPISTVQLVQTTTFLPPYKVVIQFDIWEWESTGTPSILGWWRGMHMHM